MAPEDVSAGARMYGYFTARTNAQVWSSARRNLQVSSLGCAGIHDRDKSQVLVASGNLARLRQMLDLAATDWRDVLVAAGLADED